MVKKWRDERESKRITGREVENGSLVFSQVWNYWSGEHEVDLCALSLDSKWSSSGRDLLGPTK